LKFELYKLILYIAFRLWLQYTILDDGCVCMEFFRVTGGTATVLEVMRISSSGIQVYVCDVISCSFIPLHNSPVCCGMNWIIVRLFDLQ